MSVLKELLCHTAMLSQLSQDLCPSSLESYSGLGAGCTRTVSQHCVEVMDTWRIISQARCFLFLFFSIDSCPQCGHPCVYNMEYHLHCHCIPA
jgi:hypothetical protein